MSLAARTRSAVDERPVLYDALRAGIVNYSAAARQLPVDGDEEAIATALRRYAEDLDAPADEGPAVRVRMTSGLDWAGKEDGEESVLTVGEQALVDGSGSTAIVAAGTVPVHALTDVLSRLRIEGIAVQGAGVTEEALVVAVSRTAGANALRVVENTLD